MHSHTCMWYFVSVAIRLTWEDNDSLLYPYGVPTRTLRLFYFHLLVCVFTLLLPRYLFIDSLTQLLTLSLARAASLTTNLKRLHIYSSGSRSLEFKLIGAETLTVDTGSDLDIKGQPDWYMYFFFLTLLRAWQHGLDYWTLGLWTIFGQFFRPFHNWGGVGGGYGCLCCMQVYTREHFCFGG